MPGYNQHFYHPRAGRAKAEHWPVAWQRLRSFEDAETRAIVEPLLHEDKLWVADIESHAAQLRDEAKHLIVIGSGGSGLSGKALAATHTKPSTAELHIFDSMDVYELDRLKLRIKPEEAALLFISKSGTTVETLAYLDLLIPWISQVENAHHRISVITMTNGNPLHLLAMEKRWHIIEHAPHLCGRFSIFSAVGLLPAAFIGMDIRRLLEGATLAWNETDQVTQAVLFQWDVLKYGLGVHVAFAYGERFGPLCSWWRQGLAESIGKGGKGIYPVVSSGPRDQHSQLQLYLDGAPQAMFTLLTETTNATSPVISGQALLPMLRGKSLSELIGAQQQATLETLKNAGKSIRHFSLTNHDEATIGALLMQWMQEIILLGFMLEINPFDQPAVEESKRLSREYLLK